MLKARDMASENCEPGAQSALQKSFLIPKTAG